MTRRRFEVKTCSLALINAGTCCEEGCDAVATVAVLAADLVEHARCAAHVGTPDDVLGTKPLKWAAEWGPTQ